MKWQNLHVSRRGDIGIREAEEEFAYREDLRNVLVNTQDNLNVSDRILAADRDGVFCSDYRRLGEDCISNRSFDLPDLLDSLLLGQVIKEQVDIAGRAKLFVIELPRIMQRLVSVLCCKKAIS